MNKVILMGRLTRDPEINTTSGGMQMCRFTVAIDRPFNSKDGQKQADFVPVVAWAQSAEFVSKYFRKGSPIAIEGSVRTGSYDAQDGTKRFTFDVFADRIEFVPKTTGEDGSSYNNTSYNTSYGGQTGPSISVAEPKKAQKSKKIDDLEVINDDDNDLPF